MNFKISENYIAALSVSINRFGFKKPSRFQKRILFKFTIHELGNIFIFTNKFRKTFAFLTLSKILTLKQNLSKNKPKTIR